MTMERKLSYCSWCYENCYHYKVEQNRFSRNIYRCKKCGNYTVECRFCKNMAKSRPKKQSKKELIGKIKDNWSNNLCAEHDGTIASFKRLKSQLSEITDYKSLFKREKSNLYKAGLYTGACAAGVVTIAGVAATGGAGAGPIAAALGNMGILGTAGTGAVIAELSGAALTTASLSAIGGSVAAGTAIISATGLALGGVMGGVVANRYIGEDKSFYIKRLRNVESQQKTIFINGFTQEKEDKFLDWKSEQLAYDSDQNLYGLNWASKTRYDLGKSFAAGIANPLAKKALVEIAKKGGKVAATKLNPLSWLSMIADLSSNPWHNTMLRAGKTGVLLADIISRTQGQVFNLVGHSLGCRVIYYALEALSSKKETYINDIILLGGAVGRTDHKGWQKVSDAIKGNIYNCYSHNDKVLGRIYKIANAGLSDPIGIGPIELKNKKIANVDCTTLVNSHMTWKKHYEEILQMIYDN